MSALDKPNERSLHITPVPRLGGLAIIGGVLIGVLLLSFEYSLTDKFIFVLCGGLIIGFISFLDDVYTLSSLIRIIVQLVGALFIVYSGLILDMLELPWLTFQLPAALSVLVTVVYILWMVNLYNFMDGIDGLAGGMAVIGFATFAVIGISENDLIFALSSLLVSVSSLGFLVWNYPPARIFMGDTGSSVLGYLVAVFGLWAHNAGVVPIWISAVIFSPFIVDATLTLLWRMMRREQFWSAHKSHCYQLIAESGMNRKRLVNSEYVLMLFCAIIALFSSVAEPQNQLFAILILVAIYVILISYAQKKRHS